MIDPLTRLATAIRNCQPKEASDFLRPCWRSFSDARTLLETLLPLTLEAIDLRFPDLATVKLADAIYHLAPELPPELQLPLLDAFVKHLASVVKVSLPLADSQVHGFFKAQKPSEGFVKAVARRRTLNAYYYAERQVEEESATALCDLALQVAARDIGSFGHTFTCADSLVWLSDMLAPTDHRYLTFRLAEFLARQAAPQDPETFRQPNDGAEAVVAAAAGQAGFFGVNLILAHRIQRRQARMGAPWADHLWAQLADRIRQTEPGSEEHWPLDTAALQAKIGSFSDTTSVPCDALVEAIRDQKEGAALYYLQREMVESSLSPKLLGAVLRGALLADRDPIDPHVVILPWAGWSLARQANPELATVIMGQVVTVLANLQARKLSWTFQD